MLPAHVSVVTQAIHAAICQWLNEPSDIISVVKDAITASAAIYQGSHELFTMPSISCQLFEITSI